jgi:hypothetical protein
MDLALLDFRPRLAFEDSLKLNLASSVCPIRPRLRSSFWQVVSFGRYIFKLNLDSVGQLLQAALGGFASGFEVLQLADRVFRFSVSSMAVDFHIYNSGCIDRKEFMAFFNLWNYGGPNWKHEFKIFSEEEASSWQQVRGKKSLSFADIVKLPLTGANAIPIRNNIKSPSGFERQPQTRTSVFRRLSSSPGNLASIATIGGFPLVGVNSLALESRCSIAWACRLHPLGRVLCLIGSRALILLVRFMAAECTTVPTFKIQILIGIGVVIFTSVPFGLGGLLGCWARRPSAVFSVRHSVTWSFFVPQRNLLSVSRWPHFLPLGAGPFWWEIEILRITLLGFALPWCPCPVDCPVSVASRSSPGRY